MNCLGCGDLIWVYISSDRSNCTFKLCAFHTVNCFSHCKFYLNLKVSGENGEFLKDEIFPLKI